MEKIFIDSDMLIIELKFLNALRTANREALEKDNLGELVEMEFDKPSPGQPEPLKTLTWTSALKKIAKYQGDGLWSVPIAGEWRVNERTGEVIAQNEEATNLLGDITLYLHYNSMYGYYFAYPPSWTIYEEDKSQIWIFPVDPKEGEAFIYIHVIEEGELAIFKGLQGYIVAKLSLLQSQCYEFELIEKTTTRIDYNYRLQKDSPRHQAKHYFVQHGDKVYEIAFSAEFTEFTSPYGSKLFDLFKSFRFQH